MESLTAGFVSQKFKAELIGDANLVITGVGDPRSAKAEDVCFVASEVYLPAVEKSPALSWVIDPRLFEFLDEKVRKTKTFLLTKDPYGLFARIASHFHPAPKAVASVNPNAWIHPEAKVDPSCQIEAFVSVGRGAVIEKGVILHPHVWIGEGAHVGEESVLYAGAKVYHRCVVGKRNIIHSGAVIGADGFGFAKQDGVQVKIPQLGRAVLHDDVEVGANTTIDRGTLEDTVIGEGTKIDNLVQIGHNCRLGKNNILCGFVGLSGSTIVGDDCILAGQVGTKGHVTIGDRVIVAAKSGVSKDLASDQSVKGYPPQPLNEYLKNQALFIKLPEIYKRLLKIEKELKNEN